MKKVKIIAGISWALLCLVLIIILFPGLNTLSGSVSRLPFMKINPRYTGGEVGHQIIEGSCTLDVRKPVFNGFLKERKSGFVQIDWRGELPEFMRDTIDLNDDGKKDFFILVNRKESKTDLKSFDSRVTNVLISTSTSYGWAVRVGLLNE